MKCGSNEHDASVASYLTFLKSIVFMNKKEEMFVMFFYEDGK
jgi:hypothetical protein